MIDILFVNPRESGGFFERMPPLGIASIAALLERHGHSVRIVDFEIDNRDLTECLAAFEPKILGITGTTHTRFESFRLAQMAKEYNREILTLYGGVHATFTARDTLEHIPAIDIVVRGEGEQITLDVLEKLKSNGDLSTVRGISYRSGEEIRENPTASRITPLDQLPRPAYHLLDMPKYALDMEFVHARGISLITSRGCTAKCSFCSASAMFNHKVTTHSAQRVADDIEFLFDRYGFAGVKIFDSTLTICREHVEGVCDEILRRKLEFPWECEIRVGTVDRDILAKMKKAGCYYVNFGIESASQQVLNAMRKGFTIEQAEELLKLCAEVEIRTKVFFSFGHIKETWADVEKTFSFIDSYEKFISTLASGSGVRVYPGTYLEKYAMDSGLLPPDFSWSQSFEDYRYERILQTPCVPILIQPQLGMRELEDIALMIYQRRFSGWKGLKRGLGKLADREKLRKLCRLAKIKCNRLLQRGDR